MLETVQIWGVIKKNLQGLLVLNVVVLFLYKVQSCLLGWLMESIQTVLEYQGFNPRNISALLLPHYLFFSLFLNHSKIFCCTHTYSTFKRIRQPAPFMTQTVLWSSIYQQLLIAFGLRSRVLWVCFFFFFWCFNLLPFKILLHFHLFLPKIKKLINQRGQVTPKTYTSFTFFHIFLPKLYLIRLNLIRLNCI